MMKYFRILLGALFCLLLGVSSGFAQDATEEPAEVKSLSEIFASLPQSRTEDGGFVIGEENAPITIVEFADFACPHCQTYRPIIEQVVVDYVATGQAKLELRIFPTAGGEYTYFAGQALECAQHQLPGTFWQSYELLYGYATDGAYDETIAQQVSDEYGLNYSKLLTCLEYAQQVLRDVALGQDSGVTGTPAVMVRFGDSAPEFIILDGVTYNRGGVSFDVLAQVIEAAQGETL